MLACLMGTVRGGPNVWNTLIKRVVRALALQADLAILGEPRPTQHPNQAMLFSIAGYVWKAEAPEHQACLIGPTRSMPSQVLHTS